MKKYLLLLSFCTAATIAFSQYSSKFGTISIEESNLKVCPFDPEASAVVLLDEGYSNYDDNDNLMTYYHQRIKILKEDGIKYGEVNLTYHSDNQFEMIDNIDAGSINTDA